MDDDDILFTRNYKIGQKNRTVNNVFNFIYFYLFFCIIFAYDYDCYIAVFKDCPLSMQNMYILNSKNVFCFLKYICYNISGIKPGLTKINLTTPNESHNTDDD